MSKTTTTAAPTQAPQPPAPEPLPQAGGSYTRLPDGSLVPTPEPKE